MKKYNKLTLLIVALVVISVVSCKKLSSFDYNNSPVSIYEILKQDPNFSNFRFIIEKGNLTENLNGNDQLTVFVPTNAAFTAAGYPLSTLQQMNSSDLALLAKNHLLKGKLDITTLNGLQTTLSNQQVNVQTIGKFEYVDGGDITNQNVAAANGFVNIINKLLVTRNTVNDVISSYTNATTNSQFTFLAAAILRASTGSTNFTALLTGPDAYTLFAPNNGAFIDGGYATLAAIQAAVPDVLGNILKYHLVVGTKLTTAFDSLPVKAFNGTNIYFDKDKSVRTTLWYANGISFGNNMPVNLLAKNGVVHSISRLLPAPVSTNTLATIQANSSLSMFYALILRASTADPNFNFQNILSDPLSSYTVFAVNNAGLQSAGYANVAAINNESPAVLAKILKFHMLYKRMNNINIIDNGFLPTLLRIKNGADERSAEITFTITGGYKVKGDTNINSIPVLTSNVVTTNGLINIIGSVLTP